jgi:hypothetical protein
LAASLHAQKVEKIPVFIRSAASASGFTDPSKDRRDSMKDLANKVKDSKVLSIAESDAAAVVILEVLDRETKRETNLFGRQNKSYLNVKMIVGDFETEFTGESGSKGIMKGYGAAAGKVVDQLEEWVKTNREKLTAMKKP